MPSRAHPWLGLSRAWLAWVIVGVVSMMTAAEVIWGAGTSLGAGGPPPCPYPPGKILSGRGDASAVADDPIGLFAQWAAYSDGIGKYPLGRTA